MPMEKRASAELAVHVALESGIGDVTCDQLYADEIELAIKILPYCRFIEGASYPEDFNQLLSYVNKVFTKARFTQPAFETVIKRTTEAFKQGNVRENSFEEAFIAINTQNFPWLQPLEAQDLKKADLKSCQEIFSALFADPADFVVVIVGNFETKDLLPQIEEHLGSIPKNGSSFDYAGAPVPPKPAAIGIKEVKVQNHKDAFARITLHLAEALDADGLPAYKIASQIIESRMRQILKQNLNGDQGIDASYQIPIYPRIDLPWIVIQYRSEPQRVQQVKELVVAEIKKLCDKGITADELNKIKEELKNEDEFWLRDNDYWLSTLSNYSIWGWQIKESIDSWEGFSHVTVDQVNKVLKTSILKDTYTFVYTKP